MGNRLRQSEVQHLHCAIGSHLDVGRLQIAVDDAVIVGSFERLGDLAGDAEHLVQRKRPAGDARRKVLAVNELHHERGSLHPVICAMLGWFRAASV